MYTTLGSSSPCLTLSISTWVTFRLVVLVIVTSEEGAHEAIEVDEPAHAEADAEPEAEAATSPTGCVMGGGVGSQTSPLAGTLPTPPWAGSAQRSEDAEARPPESELAEVGVEDEGEDDPNVEGLAADFALAPFAPSTGNLVQRCSQIKSAMVLHKPEGQAADFEVRKVPSVSRPVRWGRNGLAVKGPR